MGRPLADPEADAASLQQAELMDRIAAQLDAGERQEAEAALARAMAEGLDHPRAYLLRGRLAASGGAAADLAAALPWFVKASEASPRWPEPRVLLAAAYLELDRLASAEAAYRAIDEIFPHHPAGPFGQALVALRRQRHDQALTLIQEALERDDQMPEALALRARLARQAGDRATERRFWERYLAQVPTDASVYARLGELLIDDGRPESGRRSLERSYALRPDRGIALRLADLARDRGDEAAAARWQARADGPSAASIQGATEP